MQSDGQLVADVLAGGTERFAELVSRYEVALLRAAQSRLGRWDWAEEAVQETFYCAFKSLRSYNSAYSFRTWLWTILLNQCRRQYQKHKQRTSAPLSEDVLESQGTPERESPVARAMLREQGALVHELLDQLPEADADAVRLRFFGGLKFHEIAAAMQCGLSTAKNRVRRGLELLSVRIRDGATAVGAPDAPTADASQHPEARS